MKIRSPRFAFVAAVALASPILACEYHSLLNLPEPTGTWASNPMVGYASLFSGTGSSSVTDPTIINWKLNTTGAKAHSTDATINSYVQNITADVDRVAYDSTYVYMHSSDVPSHNVGPFPGNPAYPSDKNQSYRIPRNPQPASTHRALGLGTTGIMINGVGIFDGRDAATYQNDNTWHQIANVFEASSFDTGKGHPAPGQTQPVPGQLTPGTYHYHQAPQLLINQLDPGNTGQHHSPLLGFAFDGYPIYGSWGYANPDGSGGIVRETSSYQVRNITQRHTLPDNTVLAQSQWGPDVSSTYPLGDYAEDYIYSAGSGTLDQYDGRFTVTPEYPGGTYAYFMPLDVNLNNVYPYILGPSYYGVVDTADLPGGSFTVPADATVYFALTPEPTSSLLLVGLAVVGMARRRKSAAA